MSYSVYLTDPVTGETINIGFIHHMAGGTYNPNGTQELWLNITYNYARFYRRPDVLGENGIRSIYGLSGADSIPILQKAISALKNDADPDYWKPTEGNAKRALFSLLAMAIMRPDGVWKGD